MFVFGFLSNEPKPRQLLSLQSYLFQSHHVHRCTSCGFFPFLNWYNVQTVHVAIEEPFSALLVVVCLHKNIFLVLFLLVAGEGWGCYWSAPRPIRLAILSVLSIQGLAIVLSLGFNGVHLFSKRVKFSLRVTSYSYSQIVTLLTYKTHCHFVCSSP